VCALTKVITGVFRLGEGAVQDMVGVVPIKLIISSVLTEFVLDFRYPAPFRNALGLGLKAGVVENRGQISHFLLLCEITESMGKVSI